MRRSILVAALLVCSGSVLRAEYVPPTYPQTPAMVRSVSVTMPKKARLGADLKVTYRIDPGPPKDDNLFLYLRLGDRTYHAAIFVSGKTLRFTTRLPLNIPPGDYVYEAGVYRERASASGKITITGKRLPRLAKIINCGTFVDKTGVPHRWHINDAHTMFWDGKPWFPVGGMFIYDRDWNLVKAQLDLLKHYGVRDIYLHLGVNQPYMWKTYSDDDYAFFQKTIDYLDDNGFTYGLEFQALEANGSGYPYPAGGPRVDVKDGGTVRAEQKDVKEAVFIVEDKKTGSVVQSGEAKVVDDKTIEADVKVPHPGDYRVVFLPDRKADGFVMYWWGGTYEKYAARVKEHYSHVRLGRGFRFVVDPLWNEMNTSHNLIPSAPDFVQGFSKWLRNRYGSVEKLNAAWKPRENTIPSFDAAGSAVSVERIEEKPSKKNWTWVWTRSDTRLYALDTDRSQFNYDMREYIGIALRDFCNRMADDWKEIADVPVIFKCFSDVDWWHINDAGYPGGHDGLGMESYGTGEPMLMFMGIHAYGECEQATKTTWCIVTETGEGNHQDVSPSRNKPIGYTSRLGTMYANFNALISGGAKGIYQFNMMPGRGCREPWTDAVSRDPRQLEWISTYARILANSKKLAGYKPPVYYRFPAQFNPCSMELYSEPCGDFCNMGGWWWREPVERSENDIWIVPAVSFQADGPMYIVNLEKQPASERFAGELTRAISDGVRITMIGFRKDLGAIPAVDRYYTNEFATDKDGRKFQILKPTVRCKIIGETPKGEVWNMIVGNLQINSKEVFGMHGYRPEGLVTGPEKPVEPYYGMFDLLGVKLVQGTNLEGFSFEDNGEPVTVLSPAAEGTSFLLPQRNVVASYPDGSAAEEVLGPGRSVTLIPADRKLVKARLPWAPEGIMVDSTASRDSAIIERLVPEEVPATPPDAGDKSCIWVEGENRTKSNFNYSRLGGIPSLSGTAFLGLETAVPPPTDTGYYATYTFRADQPATYELWMKENYLSFSSPCEWRIDNGSWHNAPNSLVPHDSRVVTFYNAVEDSRQIFAWYHYGQTNLTKGRHTITFRVTKPRYKGTVLTMADDRPYANLIDCFVLVPGGFTPNGIQRPRKPFPKVVPPMVNLIPDASVEFDQNGDEKPDFWTPSETSGLTWTKPGWNNFKIGGLVDINLGCRDCYNMLRGFKIEAGPKERYWQSRSIAVGPGEKYLLSGWIRTVGLKSDARVKVVWLDASGSTLQTDGTGSSTGDRDWAERKEFVTAPEGAASAKVLCSVSPGESGTAFFDDFVFARL